MLNMPKHKLMMPILSAAVLVSPGCTSPTAGLSAFPPVQSAEYKLTTGDKVKVVIQDLKDGTADYTVDQSGSISLPFIKDVKISDQTLREAAASIEQAFVDQKILVRPKVSVQAIELRPIYVLGEVNRPGEYAYRDGLTIFAAASLAGGYTYRADTKSMVVVRTVNGRRISGSGNENTEVMPGDQIRVVEKWF